MKPIIFHSEMVRAIIKGIKDQTRRPIKGTWDNIDHHFNGDFAFWNVEKNINGSLRVSPFGRIGTILYVRETFCKNDHINQDVPFLYKADSMCKAKDSTIRWSPSIHMPKKAARIFLRVAKVKVEKIQDISAPDAWLEGIDRKKANSLPYICPKTGCYNSVRVFSDLWQSVYGKRGFGWEVNPWVWAIEFERVSP